MMSKDFYDLGGYFASNYLTWTGLIEIESFFIDYCETT